MLPFRPDEEEVLERVINRACAFRDFLQNFTNAACTTVEEVPTLLFYLRKIEGAEILLTQETNFFRQEIHKLAPVAPEPPPILEHSLSTRKPRPTKQQKAMMQMGVERPEELPPHLRPRQFHYYRRRSPEAQSSVMHPPSHNRGSSHSYSTGSIPTLASVQNSNGRSITTLSLPPRDSARGFTPDFSYLPHAASHSPPAPPPRGLDTSLGSKRRFGSSSPRGTMDEVFADSANEDVGGEPGPDIGPEQEPEPETGLTENMHTNEALETLGSSKGGRERHSSF